MSLSVVINTKNMATTLKRTLKSVETLADEVVVVDMNSTDDTVKVAKQAGAKIFTYEKELGFADPARNFALSKASSDWILVLDADEEVSAGLRSMIKQVITDQVTEELKGDCYFLPRQNIIFGKVIEKTGWWPDYQMRLFRKGMVKWTDQVHTHPETKGKLVRLPADPSLAIIHHNYQTVHQFVERLNRYTDLEARPQAEPWTAFSDEFIRRLFVQEGLDEGRHGLGLSLLQAMYEVVATLKHWEKAGFTATHRDQAQTLRALRRFQKDINYWIADWQIKHTTGWRKLGWQVRRKLRV